MVAVEEAYLFVIYKNILNVTVFNPIYASSVDRYSEIMFDYLGGEVDLKEFERTTADDAIRPAADGGIPLGPLVVVPS